MNQSHYWISRPIRSVIDSAYAHHPLNAICAGHGVHSKSVRALVTQALATIISLGKLAALVKVSGCVLDHYSGDQLPAVYNGGYSPHERALTITCSHGRARIGTDRRPSPHTTKTQEQDCNNSS